MFRRTTVRTLLLLLAAVLLGLQPPAPAESSGSAHRGEYVATAEAEDPHQQGPAEGTRRRVRDEDPVPGPPAPAPAGTDPASGRTPGPLRPPHPSTSGAATPHSLAALQVFRC